MLQHVQKNCTEGMTVGIMYGRRTSEGMTRGRRGEQSWCNLFVKQV